MKVPLHVVQARRERLGQLLEQHRYLPVKELCRRLGVSEATARRDLAAAIDDLRAARVLWCRRDLALTKERPFSPKLSEQVQAQAGLARAEALLRSARSYWYENVEMIWDIARCGGQPSLADRTAARLASLTVAENSLAAVDLVYRLAGSTAIFQSSPLERCFRDVHTAAQHQQVQDGRWETAGRVLFGLDPASPII